MRHSTSPECDLNGRALADVRFRLAERVRIAYCDEAFKHDYDPWHPFVMKHAGHLDALALYADARPDDDLDGVVQAFVSLPQADRARIELKAKRGRDELERAARDFIFGPQRPRSSARPGATAAPGSPRSAMAVRASARARGETPTRVQGSRRSTARPTARAGPGDDAGSEPADGDAPASGAVSGPTRGRPR